MNPFEMKTQEVYTFIHKEDDFQYKELLYATTFFEKRKREAFPEFTKYFDVISIICAILQDKTEEKINELRFNRSKFLFDKCEEIISSNEKENKNSSELTKTEGFEAVMRYYTLYKEYNDEVIKNKYKEEDKVVENIEKLIEEFKKNPEKYLIGTKQKLLKDITSEFSQKVFDKWKKEGYHRPEESDNTNKLI